MAINRFDVLDTDSKLNIFSFLSVRDTVRVLETNKENFALDSDDDFWRFRLKDDFNHSSADAGHKEQYKTQHEQLHVELSKWVASVTWGSAKAKSILHNIFFSDKQQLSGLIADMVNEFDKVGPVSFINQSMRVRSDTGETQLTFCLLTHLVVDGQYAALNALLSRLDQIVLAHVIKSAGPFFLACAARFGHVSLLPHFLSLDMQVNELAYAGKMRGAEWFDPILTFALQPLSIASLKISLSNQQKELKNVLLANNL